ncbi:MAG: g-type lysozyme inhibitor [Xanthomonadaceae bacterium]|nr:g-type lysozyme inhibitor [Xanthomonadaceae bacterium]
MTVVLAAGAASGAQGNATTVPVHFAKGSSSATLKGSFSGYDTVNYMISAKARQVMTVKMHGSESANFNVFKPGDSPGMSTALGSGSFGADWSGTLPANGKYTVQVFQMRASARNGERVPYTVTFEVR